MSDAEIQRTLGLLLAKVDNIDKKQDKADDSRRAMYQNIDTLAKEVVGITHRVGVIESEIRAIRPTSDEYIAMRERVRGAGTLGYWLWRIGAALLSAAAGAGAAYTWLTGRPPP